LDQHHPFKHHGCCPTIALHRSARTAFLAATHGSIAKPSPLPPYTDITYSIYKPPKTVI
jgi:hypothetical protein